MFRVIEQFAKSLKVIRNDTIRQIAYTSSCWRSVVTMPYLVLFPRLSDILVENRDFFIPNLHSTPSWGEGSRWNIAIRFCTEKQNNVANEKKFYVFYSRFDTILACDEHRDGQTCYSKVRLLHTHRAVKSSVRVYACCIAVVIVIMAAL